MDLYPAELTDIASALPVLNELSDNMQFISLGRIPVIDTAKGKLTIGYLVYTESKRTWSFNPQ